ncbi:MAG: pyroglutamyl-peptidase I [Pseudorhodoplanes sp.]
MKILYTGFGRFPGAPFNPSEALVRRLVRRRRPAFAELQRVAHVFPTAYAAVDRDLPTLIRRHAPDAVIMFGLAGRTPHLRIEMQARNRTTAVFPDAARQVPSQQRIVMPGGAVKRLRIPFRFLLHAAKASGLRTMLSRDAGSYVCNYGYWRAIEAGERPRGPRLVVFVHIPKIRSGIRKTGKQRATLPQLLRAAEGITLAAVSALQRTADRKRA